MSLVVFLNRKSKKKKNNWLANISNILLPTVELFSLAR